MTSPILYEVDRKFRGIEQDIIAEGDKRLQAAARRLRDIIDHEITEENPRNVCRAQRLFVSIQNRMKGDVSPDCPIPSTFDMLPG